MVEPTRHHRVLDLACGSGVLLDLCHTRFANLTSLMGVDMSADELALARERLGGKDVVLHEALAQNLKFAPPQSVDAVLCHWALTLMDPVEPVLEEIDRILSPGGVFSAVVDGDPAAAPGYEAVNDLIFQYVREELPTYGDQDLGDPRTRTPETLATLANSVFDTANVSVETSVFSLQGAPEVVAKEAAGFFYAAFVLPAPARAQLLEELAELLQKNASEGTAKFFMPVCRLVVRL
ncbi:MAG: class I SAM-dependent methyltransferase [Pseudomonadota bacterium]